MKPLGLGEHGGLTIIREGRAYVAYLRYRDYRAVAGGSSEADARRPRRLVRCSRR